jgi:hypothetical protein
MAGRRGSVFKGGSMNPMNRTERICVGGLFGLGFLVWWVLVSLTLLGQL